MSLLVFTQRHEISRHTLRCFNGNVRRRKSSTPLLTKPSLLTWYSNKLDTHPLPTKMISAGIVAFSGDILSQRLRSTKSKEPFSWDMIRTFKFGFLGFIFIAPLTHVWYGYLLKRFPGTTIKSIAIRVTIDQFMFEPIYVPSFLTAVWLFEGEGLEDVRELLIDTAPRTIMANWMVWIPATAAIFRYAPGKFQVLAANMVGFFWNAYVSYTAHQAEDEHDTEKHHLIH